MTPILPSTSSTTTTTVSSTIFWRKVSFGLSLLIILQWCLFVMVWNTQQQQQQQPQQPQQQLSLQQLQLQLQSQQGTVVPPCSSTQQQQRHMSNNIDNIDMNNNNNNNFDNNFNNDNIQGVAVTLMLRAPKWFHRRYTVMLHNVLSNIPSSSSNTWMVQVFYNHDWLHQEVLPLHPGLRQLYETSSNNNMNNINNNNRIVWTPLPKSMTTRQTKPKDVMKSKWFWESIIAENVLMFSGNGAFCANTPYKQALLSLQQQQQSQQHLSQLQESNNDLSSLSSSSSFLQYDYIGVPWYQHDGIGGDGSTHSFRHKSAMLRILQEQEELAPSTKDHSPDYQFFVKQMIKSNNNNKDDTNYKPFLLAPRNVTMAFGGVSTTSSSLSTSSEMTAPLVVSGTQAQLNWTMRESLLGICPEVKMIFPSMHEPTCFGAHPNPKTCQATICALQDPLPGHGC